MMIAKARIAMGCVLLLTIQLTPAAAYAESVNPELLRLAQELYNQGAALMDAKNFAAGCPKLERVVKLVPNGIGGRQLLAECYEKWGKLASAWQQYVEVETLAQLAGESQTAAEARTDAARLRPKLATIRILVPNEMQGLPGLSITVDGAPQLPASWGLRIPVEVGKHAVEVRAPEKQTWARVVAIGALGEQSNVSVPQLGASTPVAPSPMGARNTVHVEMPLESTETYYSVPWARPVGFALVGGGLVLLGTSITFVLADVEFGPNWLPIVLGITGSGLILSSPFILVMAPPEVDNNGQKGTSFVHWSVTAAPMGVGIRGMW